LISSEEIKKNQNFTRRKLLKIKENQKSEGF
jgi:hypothetical protein